MRLNVEIVVEKIAEWMGRDPSRAEHGTELMREIIALDREPEWIPLRETAKKIGCSTSYLYHSWERLGGKKEAGKIYFSANFGLKRRSFQPQD